DVGEAEALSHIKRQAWDETYRGIYPDEKIDNFDYDKNRETFIKMINNPDISFFVLMYADKIVGYMSTGKSRNPYRDYEQEISVLYILKEHQGKGLGSLLFKIGKGEIFKKGFDRFFISCNRLNYKAQEFYKKLGGIILSDEDLTENGDSQIHFHYDA
ncbi:MAG TPA: hypothetical protein DCY94_03215, partial [Firmicutes bacterium]|nr:hypothetical protein [Bacillota bacterium]